MRNKIMFGLGFLVVVLLVWISALANTISRKDGEIELLKDKLATSQSINDGLKDSVEKLIRYNECIAKILIAPRSLEKAIEGSINDPAAALENCRIAVDGETISTPQPSSPAPAVSQTQSSRATGQSSQGQGNQDNGTASPPPSSPPPAPVAVTPDDSVLPGTQPPLIGCIELLIPKVCI